MLSYSPFSHFRAVLFALAMLVAGYPLMVKAKEDAKKAVEHFDIKNIPPVCYSSKPGEILRSDRIHAPYLVWQYFGGSGIRRTYCPSEPSENDYWFIWGAVAAVAYVFHVELQRKRGKWNLFEQDKSMLRLEAFFAALMFCISFYFFG